MTTNAKPSAEVSATTKNYLDPSATVRDRVEDLLARMTQAEKISQLNGLFPVSLMGQDGFDPELLERKVGHGLGHISGLTNMSPAHAGPVALMADGIQRYLVERTRLGIPALGHSEALSGLLHAETSNFPTAIALAATWAPEDLERMNGIVRAETRALGIQHALSPVLDIARDARWGRVHETWGEDPYLVSAMAVAFVRGLQGEDPAEGVLATAKHFVAYGLAEGGRNISAVQVSERELYEVYCRPFEAAIREAGLASVMNSYSEVNGQIPAASRAILTDLLRGRLGFDGVVVADYGSVAMTLERHDVATDRTDASVLAIEAGLDMELPEIDTFSDLAATVTDGRVSQDDLDESVRRVLTAKFRAGVFEHPYADFDGFQARDRATGVELAREIVRKSAVLLTNDGVLPLSKNLRRIAVIGPNADSVRNLFSGYTAPAMSELLLFDAVSTGQDAVDLEGARLNLQRITESSADGIEETTREMYPDTAPMLAAIRAAVGPGTEVVHAEGCTVNGTNGDGIAEAVRTAKSSDVVVLVLGDKTGWVADATSGEGRDRSTLDLPGRQEELLAAVTEVGVPTVVVLVNGRPAPVGMDESGPGAVVEVWQPGAVGMDHVAEILFGDLNPSGKLPITVPRTAGQYPIRYGQKLASSYAGRGVPRYSDGPTSPAYAFGHGLSYTTFTYRSLVVHTPMTSHDGVASVTVEVTNDGTRHGEEVVQLYTYAPVRGVTRPVRELAGFARIALDPGETGSVTFELPVELLACIGADGQLAVHPGTVEVSAGGSSASTPVSGRFEIQGPRRILEHRTTFFSTTAVAIH